MNELQTGTQLVPRACRKDNAVIASVRGEIDLHNSPELRTAVLDVLLASKPTKLILDLADVPYMDSSAVAVLVEALQRLRKSGGRVCLMHPQPRVRGLLEIARLDTIFDIVKDEQEAMEKS